MNSVLLNALNSQWIFLIRSLPKMAMSKSALLSETASLGFAT
jgi:hypothetical protein